MTKHSRVARLTLTLLVLVALVVLAIAGDPSAWYTNRWLRAVEFGAIGFTIIAFSRRPRRRPPKWTDAKG